MRRKDRWLRGALALVLIAYMAFAPEPLLRALAENPYHRLFAGEDTEESGVVNVWHVVDFKPYQGSVTAYLESIFAEYEKKHPGVYVQVMGMDAARMRERLERGERPDVWSFSLRQGAPAPLQPLTAAAPRFCGNLGEISSDGQITALPYCVSGYLLLGNAVMVQQRGLPWPAAEPDAAVLAQAAAVQEGDFKAGQAPWCIGDARLLGELSRNTAKNAFTLLSLPLGPDTDLVQCLGIDENAQAFQARHGTALIESVLSTPHQTKLTALGLIPAADGQTQLQYVNSQMQALYEAYRAPNLRAEKINGKF